jgi:hypothetical protein
MQTARKTLYGIVAIALGVACGSDGSDSGNVTPDELAAYRELSVEVGSAASAYQANMLGDAMASVAACQAIHDEYDDTVRPQIARMRGMSGELDAFMGEHGGGAMADVDCTASGMMMELDQHHAAACRMADLSADQAEAVRHAGVMMSYTAHSSERSNQMRSALGGSAAWGPMMMGCENRERSPAMAEGTERTR